jgi:hypothetical protein
MRILEAHIGDGPRVAADIDRSGTYDVRATAEHQVRLNVNGYCVGSPATTETNAPKIRAIPETALGAPIPWFLEVAPVLIGAPILLGTYARFFLTPLLYTLLAIHAAVLIVGGHYTYADVPLGFWAQDAFGLARNHCDRIGHFAPGFVPAILARLAPQ